MEKLKIQEAREGLKKGNYKKLLRLYYVSEQLVCGRHEQLIEYISKSNGVYPFNSPDIDKLQKLSCRLVEADCLAKKLVYYEQLNGMVKRINEKASRSLEAFKLAYSNYCRICSREAYPELRDDERLESLCGLTASET